MPVGLMLATLTDRRHFGEDWLLERKFDSRRVVAKPARLQGFPYVMSRHGTTPLGETSGRVCDYCGTPRSRRRRARAIIPA